MTTKKNTKIVKHKVLPSELRIEELGEITYQGLATWDTSVSLVHWANLYMLSNEVCVQSVKIHGLVL